MSVYVGNDLGNQLGFSHQHLGQDTCLLPVVMQGIQPLKLGLGPVCGWVPGGCQEGGKWTLKAFPE